MPPVSAPSPSTADDLAVVLAPQVQWRWPGRGRRTRRSRRGCSRPSRGRTRRVRGSPTGRPPGAGSAKSSRRPVSSLWTYAWWPVSHRMMSWGESNTRCRARVISTAPRLEPEVAAVGVDGVDDELADLATSWSELALVEILAGLQGRRSSPAACRSSLAKRSDHATGRPSGGIQACAPGAVGSSPVPRTLVPANPPKTKLGAPARLESDEHQVHQQSQGDRLGIRHAEGTEEVARTPLPARRARRAPAGGSAPRRWGGRTRAPRAAPISGMSRACAQPRPTRTAGTGIRLPPARTFARLRRAVAEGDDAEVDRSQVAPPSAAVDEPTGATFVAGGPRGSTTRATTVTTLMATTTTVTVPSERNSGLSASPSERQQGQHQPTRQTLEAGGGEGIGVVAGVVALSHDTHDVATEGGRAGRWRRTRRPAGARTGVGTAGGCRGCRTPRPTAGSAARRPDVDDDGRGDPCEGGDDGSGRRSSRVTSGSRQMSSARKPRLNTIRTHELAAVVARHLVRQGLLVDLGQRFGPFRIVGFGGSPASIAATLPGSGPGPSLRRGSGVCPDADRPPRGAVDSWSMPGRSDSVADDADIGARFGEPAAGSRCRGRHGRRRPASGRAATRLDDDAIRSTFGHCIPPSSGRGHIRPTVGTPSARPNSYRTACRLSTSSEFSVRSRWSLSAGPARSADLAQEALPVDDHPGHLAGGHQAVVVAWRTR